MKKWGSTYYLKLILFSLFLVTFPVIALGMFSYFRASGIIQEKVNEGNEQILTQTQMGVEQVLKTIDNSTINFVSSKLLDTVISQPMTVENFQLFNDISYEMNKLQTSELKISHIHLISIKNDWLINDFEKTALSNHKDEKRLLSYLNLPKASMWIMEKNGPEEKNKDEKVDSQESVGINLVKKVPFFSLDPDGLVIVQMPASRLSELITANNNLGEVMILDGNFCVLAHRNSSMLGKDLSLMPYIYEMQCLDTPTGQFSIKLEGGWSEVTFRKSEYNGWIYLSIASINDITKDSKAIGWVTLFTGLGILTVMFAISFLGSHRMYIPIKGLYRSIIGIQPGDETAKSENEIKFIEERVQKLLSDNSRMMKQVLVQENQLKEYFILKLFKGTLKQNEIGEKLEQYGYVFANGWKWLCVVVVQIDTLEDTSYNERDIDLMMFAVNNIAGELIPAVQRLNPVLVEQYQATLIGSNHETVEGFKDYVNVLAVAIQKTVLKVLKLKVSVGISRFYSDLAAASTAYQEAAEALKYRIKLGEEVVLSYENVKPSQSVTLAFPKQIEHELIDAVKLIDRQKLDILIKQFIEELFKEELHFQEYQFSLLRLLIDLIGVAQDSDGGDKSFYDESKTLFEQFFKLKTTKEIERWFRYSVIEPIVKMLEESRKSRFRKLSDEVINIIHEKYNTDLTIETCASILHYNPVYIRRVFLAETGTNFGKYLSDYRMSVAKKWLAETDMKISSIAERLMYNNSQNFIRHFRQVEGITPGQYRDMNNTGDRQHL